jgi:hypothetical protein
LPTRLYVTSLTVRHRLRERRMNFFLSFF